MSWKGFTKGAARLPQSTKSRFNIGDNTKDAIFIDAERRFKQLEQETKKLHEDSKKYQDGINGMLNHQIEFSKAIQEIYKPISGRASDINSAKPEGNERGIKACEEYEAAVKDLQETLKPELEMLETRVIQPANDLLAVVKEVQKMLTKRNHKLLDYDRHRATLKKLQDKKEKTLKDEKALYSAENALEAATQDYNYFNDMMKEELPTLFALEADFIRPLFQNFYYMQLNIFYTLNEKMRTMEIDYFDFNVDIEEQFHAKRGDVKEQAEQLSIVHFKGTGKKPSTFAGKSKYATERDRKSAVSSTYGSTHRRSTSEQPPPPYSAATNGVSPTTGKALGRSSSLASAAAGKKPPPPAPKPSGLSRKEHAVALYDYTAQAEGDLTFKAGDRIEIVRKGDDANEWWVGRINGEEGQFPANYTQLEK